MLSYFLFFLLLGMLSLADILNLTARSKNSLFNIIVACCILFIGGRFECDNDYANYITFYNATPPLWEMTWDKFIQLYMGYQVEPFFFIFSSLFKSFLFNGQAIILFYAAATMLVSARFIKKTSCTPCISFFLYATCYFSMPFMQMRFGLASACCLYAIYHLQQGNKASYWKWQLIAILFHMTAIIGLVYYAVRNITITPKRSYLILASSFLFIFFPIRTIFTWGINLIGMNRYLIYLNEEATSLNSCLIHIILFSPLFIFQNRFRKYIQDFDFFFKMAILTILLMVITVQLPILNRFSLLFASSSCIFLTYYMDLFKGNKSNQILVWLGLFFYALLKFYPSLQYLDNYQFFLFH